MRNTEDKADKRTEKRKLGDIGENIACEYLRRHGYRIVEQNYLRKWGELDIVAKKGPILHFVEVKSISRENLPNSGSQETLRQSSRQASDAYRAEDNMHPGKLKRLYRTIETYLLHRKQEGEWQLDLIVVEISLKTRQARVEMMENIVA